MSDLHIEFADFEPPDTGADVVILAGDIHVGTRGIEWAADVFENTPVIYVTGNHEYYREAIPKLTDTLRDISEKKGIHFLENDMVSIDGVVFLGCTLWNDFDLIGSRRISMITAGEMMNDYRLIRHSPQFRRLKPIDTAVIHSTSKKWLESCLKTVSSNEKIVIVTHHAPSLHSISDYYRDDPLCAAFASDMEDLIKEYNIDLWIHGHLHHPSDYAIGNTRVICNPRGYPKEFDTGFNPALTIEI